MSQASGELRAAADDVDRLTSLEKHNRRSDRQQVETLLADEKKTRAQALTDAAAIEEEAAHWVDAGAHLPQQIPEMEREYRAIHNFDFAPVTADVQRAENDWPEKKSDLEARLAASHTIVTQIDTQWQSTDGLRRQAAAGVLKAADAGTLLAFEDTLQTSAADLPRKASDLKTLSAQLYTTWDKLLVDMKTHDGEYQQKVRTVRTHMADAAAKSGDVSNDEQWTTVPHSTYDAMRNDLGMAIEHKPAGKYDFEADHVAQPAGFAYVAPPFPRFQPVRLLGPSRRPRFLGLLRPVRASARPALQSRLPPLRPLRMGKLSHLLVARPDLLRAGWIEQLP